MREATTEKLAKALQLSNAPKVMIERARAGYYDDYRSEVPDPIRTLVNDARKYHLNNIAIRAMNGEFDGQTWEGEEWAKSEEGQATFREIVQGGSQA